MASWLVRSTPERAVRVQALAGDIVLCSWARQFTLTVIFSNSVAVYLPLEFHRCRSAFTNKKASEKALAIFPDRGLPMVLSTFNSRAIAAFHFLLRCFFPLTDIHVVVRHSNVLWNKLLLKILTIDINKKKDFCSLENAAQH